MNRFIDADQLAEQVMVIAEKLDRETWDHAMGKSKDLMDEFLEDARRVQRGMEQAKASIKRAVRRQPDER